MAGSRKRKESISYRFIALPFDLLTHESWHGLPIAAKALAVDLMGQYTGRNNGRLCPAFEVMKRSGWASKSTVLRAKAALLETPFTLQTRKGHAPRTAEWLGFTFWRLDYHDSMDVDAAAWPYWRFNDNRIFGAGRSPKITSRGIESRPMTPLRGIESRPMAVPFEGSSVSK